MRFRLGFATGFATGYYLGAKAGRERYAQLRSGLDQITRSEAFHAVTDKARQAIGEGVGRARDKAREKARVVVQRARSDSSTNGSNGYGTRDPGVPGPSTALAPGAGS